MLITLFFMTATAWNMVYFPNFFVSQIDTFLSINKSKPVELLMTQPEGFGCYKDEKEVLRFQRVKSLKECRI